MATPPVASLVAPLGSTVEPLPHAPQSIQPTRIRRIRVVDDAILQNERTHPRPLAQQRGPISTSAPDIRVIGTGSQQRALATIVVFDAALAPLFFRSETDAVVGVEIAPRRGCPRKRPAHAPFVRMQLRKRPTRYCPEHHVLIGQMNLDAIEPVRDRRAGRARG